MKIKEKITLDGSMACLSVILISLFTLNPIIQAIWSKLIRGDGVWFPFREFYNYVVLGVGILAFAFYIAYRFMTDRDVDLFGIQKRNPALVLFLLFAVWMTVSTFANRAEVIFKTGFNNVALIGSEYRNEGLLTYFSYLMYFLFAAFLGSEKTRLSWLKCFGVVSSVIAVLSTVDFLFPSLRLETMYVGSEHDNGCAPTFFNNTNHEAYYMLIAAAVCALLFVIAKERFERILFGTLAFFGISGIIVNNTLGCIVGYLGVCAAVLLVFPLSEKKLRWIHFAPLGFFAVSICLLFLISVPIRVMVLSNVQTLIDAGGIGIEILIPGGDGEELFSDDFGSSRGILWKTSGELIRQKPWLGYSSDGQAHYLTYHAGNDRCHCEYLNYALSFGIPALVLYLGALFFIFLRAFLHRKALTDSNKIGLFAAFGYCISALVGNTMFYTAPLLFIMLGVGYYRSLSRA